MGSAEEAAADDEDDEDDAVAEIDNDDCTPTGREKDVLLVNEWGYGKFEETFVGFMDNTVVDVGKDEEEEEEGNVEFERKEEGGSTVVDVVIVLLWIPWTILLMINNVPLGAKQAWNQRGGGIWGWSTLNGLLLGITYGSSVSSPSSFIGIGSTGTDKEEEEEERGTFFPSGLFIGI